MSNIRRNPHPNSPAGSGGPGGFRLAGPIGINQHQWAGLNETGTELDLLNVRISAEAASQAGWMPDSSQGPTGRRKQILANSSDIEKLKLAVERALPKLPAEVRDKVKAMLTPKALATLAAIAAVWGASHWIGVGEVVDVLLLGWGIWSLGSEALDAGKDLYQFVTTATGAQTDEDIDKAADYFAGAIAIIGVDGLAAILAHKAFKAVRETEGTGSISEGSAIKTGAEANPLETPSVRSARIAEKPPRAVVPVGQNAFEYYLSEAMSQDVSTEPHQAVFYSGPGNRVLAETFAAENGKLTLEKTPGGSWLDSQRLFDNDSLLTQDEARQVWSVLSKRYAEQASGNVVGFVEGASPNGIFERIEYPTLRQNPNVTNIITGGF